jgi:hypothetical protein
MKKRLLTFGVAGLIVLLVASFCLAEIEFSVGGHFRARSYMVANPDLVKGGPERSYTDQRLILNPVLKLSDWIQVKMRLRALDYIWGHNTVPGLTWPEQIDDTEAATGQGEGGSNNFQWDRAWVHIFLGKYGSLQIGRQQTDLFHNYSIAEDDTYPRYHYITPVFNPGPDQNLMFGILYDKRSEGNVDRVTDVIVAPPAGIGARANDSFAWATWGFFWNPQVTIGAGLFEWVWSGIGPAGEASVWNQIFVMINTKLGPVDIKSEGDIFFGKMIGTYLDYKHNLQFFVDASVPVETSPYIDRAAVVVGLFQGTTDSATDFTGSLGSNEDWVDEWKIDLILWDQIYNAIYNAWIIRPKIDFVIPDTKWGGFLSACMSFADQEPQYNPAPAGITLGTTEKTIGTEIDLGINYTVGPRQTIELVGGIFMPGKYFAEANRDTTIGAAVKTHIRF